MIESNVVLDLFKKKNEKKNKPIGHLHEYKNPQIKSYINNRLINVIHKNLIV